MEILNETYQVLKALRFVKTEEDYSLNWLHKSHRYYSMIKHSEHNPSIGALYTLLAHLKEHSRLKEADPENEQGKLVMIRLLEQRLETELYQMALAGRVEN